jgi:apolipoprotein N-acyltransferase
MKKTTILWAILDLIFLIIFNAVFFVLGGFKQPASVWISYGFIHFAYLMLVFTPKLIRPGKSAAVFGFSLYVISSVHFLIELIVGTVFIVYASESYKALLLIQIIITALYGVFLISYLIANEHTADTEEKRQSQIEYVKIASVKLKGLVEKVGDKEAKKKVEKVYDAIYSSPVKSYPALAQIENHILQSIDELENAVSTENKGIIISLAGSLLESINERNRRLKITAR